MYACMSVYGGTNVLFITERNENIPMDGLADGQNDKRRTDKRKKYCYHAILLGYVRPFGRLHRRLPRIKWRLSND